MRPVLLSPDVKRVSILATSMKFFDQQRKNHSALSPSSILLYAKWTRNSRIAEAPRETVNYGSCSFILSRGLHQSHSPLQYAANCLKSSTSGPRDHASASRTWVSVRNSFSTSFVLEMLNARASNMDPGMRDQIASSYAPINHSRDGGGYLFSYSREGSTEQWS